MRTSKRLRRIPGKDGTMMKEALATLFHYIFNEIKSMGINDYIDIILVSILLYYLFSFIRDRRAGKLALGVIILLLSLALSSLFQLNVLNFILENIVQVGLLAIFIIFQPELRSVLEKMGNEPIRSLKISNNKEDNETINAINEIATAAQELSAEKTGALIVIEKNTKLGDEVKTGVLVNALISTFLIRNVFYDKAPLHDGAMIIRDNRILACGCFLPISSNADIILDLGTRHRAAVGMSENSDAVIIVISEETGIISVAKNGRLLRNFDRYSLTNELYRELVESNKAKMIKNRLKKPFDKTGAENSSPQDTGDKNEHEE